MFDTIDETIELLETAYAERNWELVLTAIQLLNEIPTGSTSSEEDEDADVT